jgi:hypothetical protein
MKTKTIIVNRKGTQYYAAEVGFPVNYFRKTLRGALLDAKRIQENNPQNVYTVKNLVS